MSFRNNPKNEINEINLKHQDERIGIDTVKNLDDPVGNPNLTDENILKEIA